MPHPAPRRVDEFIGREEHFERLKTAWRDVKEALSGPRVVTLLAEPGLGKTRLVQEFYRWLVASEQGAADAADPEVNTAPASGASVAGGYWPADLAADDDSLQVNPAEGSWNTAAAPPFLWWGIRLSDPGERNRVSTGALPGHVEQHLVPHLEPFHRAQRQRQRLLQLAKVGGAVAADAVIDLVPFLGLAKKVGEIGLELKGIHDGWRKDAQVVDAATGSQQRRASLVDQLLADLSRLFSGPAGRRVPAVIVLDDAQFSASDPALSAFVEALLPAMTEGRWPLLLLVTHWEGEWRAAERSPVAGLLQEHGRQELDGVSVLELGPLTELGTLLQRMLPGLSADQHGELAARAGGNPRFLEELVRYATGPVGRGLFVGRDHTAALSETGFAKLLAKSVRLSEVVVERLAAAPEVVQRVVVLAGLQGPEFSQQLIRATATGLGDNEVEASAEVVTAAVDEAVNPHALVARLGAGRAAFSQRLYQEAARELLPAWYDEDEAVAALREAVDRLLSGEQADANGPDVTEFEAAELDDIYSLAVALFEHSEAPRELRLAVHANHQLLRGARSRNDLHAAHTLATRQAGLLERLADDHLDGELEWLRTANGALAAFGDHDAQRSLLVRLLRLTGETYDDDVNPWSAAKYVDVLLDVARFSQDMGLEEQRGSALVTAVDALAKPELDVEDPQVLAASLRLHQLYAAWLQERGEWAASLTSARFAGTLARRLTAAQPGAENRYHEASVLSQLGRTALVQGDLATAVDSLERATAEVRSLLDEIPAPGLEIQLAANLEDLAEALLKLGEHDGRAAAQMEEALSLMRRHLAAAPQALQAQDNMADSLERAASVVRALGEPHRAQEFAAEAVALRRAVANRSSSAVARGNLGLALVAQAGAAADLGDHAAGLELAEEGVALLRDRYAQQPGSAERGRLVVALCVIVPLAAGREGLRAARNYLEEAEELLAGLPVEAVGALRSQLEVLRAEIVGLAGGSERN